MHTFRFFIAAVLLFFLSEPGLSIAQQGQVATQSGPYKIGLFPAAGNFGQENRSTQEKGSADILRGLVQAHEGLALAYSYYHQDLSQPRIVRRDRVWTDDVIRKKPKLGEVRKFAGERRLDGVVMAWGDTPMAGVPAKRATLEQTQSSSIWSMSSGRKSMSERARSMMCHRWLNKYSLIFCKGARR